jgi:cytochrome c oxidase cbb3-type subunit 1
MMSIRAVNSLSHCYRLDHRPCILVCWVGEHGMITFGVLYFLTPRLWGRAQMHSMAAINWHFWLAIIGIVLYTSMWVTGIMEGLMWREVDAQEFPRELVRRHCCRKIRCTSAYGVWAGSCTSAVLR